ncbi:hypothetical protein Tco_0519789 [Tanacetum coccineum]
MTGTNFLEGGSRDNDETTLPTTKEHIKGYLSALRSLVKEHNSRGNVSLIRLNFDEDGDGTIGTRKEFAGPKFKMSANVKLYDGTMVPEDRLSRFSSAANSGGKEGEQNPGCFQERVDHGDKFIVDVPEVMKISSFIDSHKCPKLAKWYSEKVSKTVDEMMVRLDDFVRSEEDSANTELPKGEVSEALKKLVGPVSQREDRFHMGGYKADRRRNDRRNTFNHRDGLAPNRPQSPIMFREETIRDTINPGLILVHSLITLQIYIKYPSIEDDEKDLKCKEISVKSANEPLGWHLEEIHATWAHLEKKRTRLRLYTKYIEEPRIQSVETASLVQRISLTGFPAQSVRSSNTNVLDSPCLLVLNTGTSQSRQHGWVDGNGSNLGGGFGKPGGGRETRGDGDVLEGPGGQLSMV